MAKKLSENQKNFCEEYVKNWYNWKLAYEKAYPNHEATNAASNVDKLLKNQSIRDYIEVVEGSFSLVWKKLWVDKTFVVKWLLEWMIATRKIFDRNGNFKEEIPDWNTRMRAFKQFWEMAWYTKESPKALEDDLEYTKEDVINIWEMSEEEMAKYKAKLLKDLQS